MSRVKFNEIFIPEWKLSPLKGSNWYVSGDVMDEGKWSSDSEFRETVARFHKMFRVSSKTELQILVGNHDIGFHYMWDFAVCFIILCVYFHLLF